MKIIVRKNSEMEIFKAVFFKLKSFKVSATLNKTNRKAENSKLIISLISEVATIKHNK